MGLFKFFVILKEKPGVIARLGFFAELTGPTVKCITAFPFFFRLLCN
ncbi:hypothetical protein GMMP1_1410034 [Candidatus Magnetomoraceae bacterium gMMP-1]